MCTWSLFRMSMRKLLLPSQRLLEKLSGKILWNSTTNMQVQSRRILREWNLSRNKKTMPSLVNTSETEPFCEGRLYKFKQVWRYNVLSRSLPVSNLSTRARCPDWASKELRDTYKQNITVIISFKWEKVRSKEVIKAVEIISSNYWMSLHTSFYFYF